MRAAVTVVVALWIAGAVFTAGSIFTLLTIDIASRAISGGIP